MLNSLSTAVSGLQQFQQHIDVIGNNIANVNTIAYKNARATSADTFSETLQGAMGGGVQVGTGVATSDVSSVFSQGNINYTGSLTHMAVSGRGFFTVRDPLTGASYATRDGSFQLDNAGYLVTSQGYRVQGFQDSSLATRGDIRLDASGAPAGTPADAQVGAYRFDSQGKLQVTLDTGETFVRGQVLLQDFVSPQSLTKQGQNLYGGIAAAGPLAQTASPGSAGLGSIQAQNLESSNVDLAGEFTELITAQRGFQANSRVITTSDEVLQDVINLKR